MEVKKYRRKVLFRCKEFELVRTVWPPGSASAIHDHPGIETSIAIVRKGKLKEHVYHLNPNEYRYPVIREAGQVFQETTSRVHKMENEQKDETAVVYYLNFPPMGEMKTYPEELFKPKKATL